MLILFRCEHPHTLIHTPRYTHTVPRHISHTHLTQTDSETETETHPHSLTQPLSHTHTYLDRHSHTDTSRHQGSIDTSNVCPKNSQTIKIKSKENKKKKEEKHSQVNHVFENQPSPNTDTFLQYL